MVEKEEIKNWLARVEDLQAETFDFGTKLRELRKQMEMATRGGK
jgi:hypothetical protein